MNKKLLSALVYLLTVVVLGAAVASAAEEANGNTTYLVDPVKGDDANPAGKPWKTYGK